ncbi:MAG: MFS transporter [Gemmatimonadota bacterium]|nr:MAG: MFS transporter [Gemmatimonadota bacterium]
MDRTHFKRNYFLGIANGVLFNVAFTFISGSTILPAFLSRLTTSSFLIGAIASLEEIGWLLPQYFVAGLVQSKARKKPVYVIMAVFRSIAFGLLALSVFLYAHQRFHLLVIFLVLFCLFAISGGIAGVAFLDITGKTIPPHRRGSFFGWRVSLGGALSFIASLTVIRLVLSNSPYPQNYGTLFAINFFIISAALISFCLVKEPDSIELEERKSLRDHHRRGFEILREDLNYRRFLIFRWLIGSFYMGLPFYIIYAIRKYGLSESTVGVFLAVQMLGVVTSNLLWGWLSNNASTRVVLQLTATITLFPPLLVLSSTIVQVPILLFGLLFFFLGAFYSGIRTGYHSFLLAIAPAKERPTYVGMMNTFIAPTLLFSGIGGVLLDMTSFPVLYSIVLLFGLAALYSSLKLQEPFPHR